MGNTQRSKPASTLSHNRLSSNVVHIHLAPSAAHSAPNHSIECQTASVSCCQEAVEPLGSPKTDPYSGSMQSLGSSADVSNRNAGGGAVSSSQHIDSQVISNFLSSIFQPEHKEQRRTEYSEGKEEDNCLHMTK